MIKKYKVGVLGCAHIAIRSLLPTFSSSERFELGGIGRPAFFQNHFFKHLFNHLL